MRTASHLHSTDELADGRHHVIPCPVPGHEGARDSPGLDVRYPPKAAGRLPIGRQCGCSGAGETAAPYGSIVQALGIAPESASVGENANHMVAAYDHVDGLRPVQEIAAYYRRCNPLRSSLHRQPPSTTNANTIRALR